MSHSPLSRYHQLIEQCELTPDAGQQEVAEALETLYHAMQSDALPSGGGRSFLSRLFAADSSPDTPKGLYLWGGVGRGKSMLMDMFYDSLISITAKKRVHFHAFMQDVHARIHTYRADGETDPLKQVADAWSRDYQLLCFDELQVHDITDAMLLARLFGYFFEKGVVVVFTSNRPPEDLYLNGLQRERFLPFIALIGQHTDVLEIRTERDFRQQRLAALQQRYLAPVTDDTQHSLKQMFAELTGHMPAKPMSFTVQGRNITIDKACGDVGWCTFDTLCDRPLGAKDYLELAQLYKVLFIDGIPVMTPEHRNQAKRFVTLIDALYEAETTLFCTAQAMPEALYDAGDGHFEFERTSSRLREMMSEAYGR